MTELTTTLPGILALSMAVILYVVAFVIIRGITKVEV
jgi:hypothetical protein